MLHTNHGRIQALLRQHSGKRGPEGRYPSIGSRTPAPMHHIVVLKVSGALPDHGVLKPLQITLRAPRAHADAVKGTESLKMEIKS